METITPYRREVPTLNQMLVRMHGGHARLLASYRNDTKCNLSFREFHTVDATLFRWGCTEKIEDGTRYGKTVLTSFGNQLLEAFYAKFPVFRR